MSQLREGDVDRMVAVIEDARRDEPGEAMPWLLLEGLQRLVPCTVVSYQDHDLTNRCSLMQDVDDDSTRGGPWHEGPFEVDEPFFALWWSSICSWPLRSGDVRSVTLWDDFFASVRARRSDPLIDLLVDVQQEMMLSLPAPPGHARRILFLRDSDTAFTERDRQVISLLRPHVEEIWLDAERRRDGVPRLSDREWQVLALVAGGLSHAEVARILHVAPGIVRKHMENVRERLGVHSAAAAAAVAMPHAPSHLLTSVPGPLPPGP